MEPTPEDERDEDRPWCKWSETSRCGFPVSRKIDFIRVLVIPGESFGTCWTKVSPPWETRAEIEYSIDGKKDEASGIRELKAKGWWPTYRAPQGHGFERRAEFDFIDMKLGATMSCVCADRAGETEKEFRAIDLRFRWERGKMPEIGAGVVESGKRRGLSPSTIYGHFLTYDFAAKGRYPGRGGGPCEVRAVVAILGDPPIL